MNRTKVKKELKQEKQQIHQKKIKILTSKLTKIIIY